MRADPSAERLRVGHWPGQGPPPGAAAGALLVATCQRRLLVAAGGEQARGLLALSPPESYAGAAAYQFLLEVATGLRSAIPGETNVFSQFRSAWESHRSTAPAGEVEALAPVVARVIRDTRAIRHEHLQNIGGASYGPLVRRLLRPQPGDHVLLVGAGDLARSMLPFFRRCVIGTWNRSPPGAAFAAAGRVFAPEEGAAAGGWARHVIMTTPADGANDERWREWLEAASAQSLVHLGRRRAGPFPWPERLATFDLDDVFDLRRAQDNVRSAQLERARLACRERARQHAPDVAPGARLAAG